MKKILVCLLFPTLIFAQQDSLIVVNTFDYDLRYGISSEHRYCSNQKTYSIDGQLLREFNYYKDSMSKKTDLTTFVYYFYDDNSQLISEEYYVPEIELVKAIKYQYKNGQKILKQKFIADNNILTKTEETKYKYADGKLVQKTHKNEKNKKDLIVSIDYSSDNSKIITKEYTKFANVDLHYNKIVINQKLDGEKKLESKRLEYKDNRLVSDTMVYKYNYADDGLLKEILFYRNSGFQNKKTYTYYPDKRIKSISVTNDENRQTNLNTMTVDRIFYEFGGLESVFKGN